MVQETHFGLGKESTQWTSKDWHCIVSVDSDKRFSGVAIFLRRSVAPDDCIKFQEIIKGRLLHARVFPSRLKSDPGCSIDVLCAYQHAGDDEKTMAGGRQKFWTTLSRTLSTLPGRNLLVLGGDFNCTPEPSSGHVGHGHRAPAHYRADARV